MKYRLADKCRRASGAYKPDLDEHLSQCELNYLLLNRLIPQLDDLRLQPELFTRLKAGSGAEKNIGACWELTAKAVKLVIAVTEMAPYTTTMKLWVNTPKLKLSQGIELIIRLYHDAKMLEVMEGAGPSALKAVHQKSEKGAKPVDEKRQINRFVGECMRACL